MATCTFGYLRADSDLKKPMTWDGSVLSPLVEVCARALGVEELGVQAVLLFGKSELEVAEKMILQILTDLG
jgi:hypothetical protein